MLICAWHLEKSWRGGLHEHVAVKSKQPHHLRVLLSEGSESGFRHRLQQFISWLSEDPDLINFATYFQKQYVPRLEQWAPCYRATAIVNTNMATEAFHRLIKVCYMEKKHNRRIDHLIHVLLKVARDKVFERLLKLHKGKLSHRICEIHKRHKTALKNGLDDDKIVVVDNGWSIQSFSTQQSYLVRKIGDECSCKLCCRDCNICVHTYSCTCMDYLLHNTICKHIHLLKMWIDSKTRSSDEEKCGTGSNMVQFPELNDTLDYTSNDDGTGSMEYFNQKVGNKYKSDIASVRSNLLATCKTLECEIAKCTAIQALHAGEKHLNAALVAIKSLDKLHSAVEIPVRKRPAPNQNMEKQLRFNSTKKKRQKKPRLAKPSLQELENCIDELDDTEVAICAICMKPNDHTIGMTIDWLECDHCGTWFHQTCVKLPHGFDIDRDRFICKFCDKETL